MAEVARYVVDASVGAKWHLRDEELTAEADAVRWDFAEGRNRLIAPDLITHEVSAAILKATRNPERTVRLTDQIARQELTAWLSRGLELLPSGILAPIAYGLARRLGCSYYDAVYLALAEETGTPFLYADNKLRNALGNRFPLALWIEDYLPHM